MLKKCNAGIDLITNNLGELYAGRTYLLSGAKGTAKTTFALQFIWQGLREGETCLLLANQPPKEIVIYADSLGMDLSPYFLNGSLLVYEISSLSNLSPAPLFHELEAIISMNRISRAALECFGSTFTTQEQADVLANGTSSFLRALEKMEVTSFFTMGLPLPQGMFMLKKTIEDLVAGSFMLSNTANNRIKTLSVKKLLGSSNGGKELQFSVEMGRGIVETAKSTGVKFPGFSAASFSAPRRRLPVSPDGPEKKRTSVSFSKISPSENAQTPKGGVKFPDKAKIAKPAEASAPEPALPAYTPETGEDKSGIRKFSFPRQENP
ncbi:MAG: RAD55 family ATPase [Elusimicrobiaceae bacterium]